MSIPKKYRGLFIIIALLLVFLVSAVMIIGRTGEKSEKKKRVSLIVYGDDSERWESARQGAAAGSVCTGGCRISPQCIQKASKREYAFYYRDTV